MLAERGVKGRREVVLDHLYLVDVDDDPFVVRVPGAMEFLVGVCIDRIGGICCFAVLHFLVPPGLELFESLLFVFEQSCIDETVGVRFRGGDGDVCYNEQCSIVIHDCIVCGRLVSPPVTFRCVSKGRRQPSLWFSLPFSFSLSAH